MKTLIIIRHAKAEQESGIDSKRKLTERGLRNAEQMAKQLLALGYKIDKIFSSPAARTAETAAIFAATHHIKEEDIKFLDNIYLGDTLQITEAVNRLKEDLSTLAVIGHNPGVANFINDTTDSNIEHFPTCGIGIIKIDCTDWQQFDGSKKTLEQVLTPKSI